MFRNHPYRALRCSFRACWRLLIMICHVRSGNITWNEVHHGILFDRRLGVTGRAKYEILAAAVDFCTMVCNHWPWYFPRHFEWKAVESEAESFFFNVTSVSWKEEFFTRWEASKTWGTRRSIKRTSNMTFHRTREFALSLEWSHQQISALCTAHTMVLAMFLFMFPDMVLHPQAWAIPAHMQNLTMKGAEPMRETWSLLSEMSEHRPSF